MTTDDTTLLGEHPQSYRRQWLITLLIAVAIGAWIGTRPHFSHPPVPPPASEQHGGNWFYVLRMPEMQIHSDPRASRAQLSKWIETLKAEGFQFFLLSDVVRHLSQGTALPEKSAVLVFDPGYRSTAQTYVSVLKKMNVPAVWMTDAKALEANDTRYISQHAAETMEASGLWDIGLYAPGAPVTLKSHGHETVLLGHQTPWKESAGRFAVNQGLSTNAFERLNVNAKWTEQDLLHRLMVEYPIHGATILSMQQIQGRNWGMGLDANSTREDRFTVRAPSNKRSDSLYWLGTRGINDAHIRMDVKSLVGEMRLLLRSDPVAGNSLSIIFGRGKVSVDQERNFQTERLTQSPCPDLAPYTPFNATLALMGKQLALAINNHPLIALDSLAESDAGMGMLRLAVQDGLKGVAEARSVRIVFTPLGKEK